MNELERLKLSNERLLDICDEQERRIAELQIKLNRLAHGELAKLNMWHWQSDGENHLESLTCMILIHPMDLKDLLWEQRQFRLNDLLSSKTKNKDINRTPVTLRDVDNTVSRASLFPRCVSKLWTK